MELNKRVLLVDADVSRPSLMRSLALGQSAGFLDVLANPPREMSSVLLRTNLETLSLLPAGEPRPFATEMIGSEAAARLLVEMAERYPDRIIVFDAPPLLPSTESRVLATHMGQVILVVAAEQHAAEDRHAGADDHRSLPGRPATSQQGKFLRSRLVLRVLWADGTVAARSAMSSRPVGEAPTGPPATAMGPLQR
jgi:Mrp family chromosome partitioning ATPase